jgi:hypothetical protein
MSRNIDASRTDPGGTATRPSLERQLHLMAFAACASAVGLGTLYLVFAEAHVAYLIGALTASVIVIAGFVSGARRLSKGVEKRSRTQGGWQRFGAQIVLALLIGAAASTALYYLFAAVSREADLGVNLGGVFIGAESALLVYVGAISEKAARRLSKAKT